MICLQLLENRTDFSTLQCLLKVKHVGVCRVRNFFIIPVSLSEDYFCWVYLSLSQLFPDQPVLASVLWSSDTISSLFGSCHPNSNWSCFVSSEREEWVKEFCICHSSREAIYAHFNHRLHGWMEYFLIVLTSSCSEAKADGAVELRREP